MIKHVLFLSGTRADFGKLKSLILAVQNESRLTSSVFVTGMHLMRTYGNTYIEVIGSGIDDAFCYHNQHLGEPMETVLANTIEGLSRYVHEMKPDMIVVHGDRVETLAGAIVGSLNNILVGHVEGGERSGTVDELIRHSVTKLSHLHFAANPEARRRLIQMGEIPESVFVIGSPDLDIMRSPTLPSIGMARERYDIQFPTFGLLLFHPVTTEIERLETDVNVLIDSLIASGRQYVVVYPNNDSGSDIIIKEYQRRLIGTSFRVFPSLRFEYFLTILRHSSFIIGNSSAGVREAPAYGVPTINIGSRQNGRYSTPSIIDVSLDRTAILSAIQSIDADVEAGVRLQPDEYFGDGNSTERFIECLASERVWSIPVQKMFRDFDSMSVETGH